MLSITDHDEPTVQGYWDGADWVDCTGMVITPFVVSWAHMPAGFFPSARKGS